MWHEQLCQQCHCQPALPKKLLMALVSWAKGHKGWRSSGDARGGWAERNLLLLALQWEQLFGGLLLLAICKARCSCCWVLSSPGGAGAVPGRLWPVQLCGLVGTGLS